MLSLKRNEGQAIFIADDIQVRVLQIGPEGVRIGITAPESVRIDRKESKRQRPNSEDRNK